jgi:hypothetical protein
MRIRLVEGFHVMLDFPYKPLRRRLSSRTSQSRKRHFRQRRQYIKEQNPRNAADRRVDIKLQLPLLAGVIRTHPVVGFDVMLVFPYITSRCSSSHTKQPRKRHCRLRQYMKVNSPGNVADRSEDTQLQLQLLTGVNQFHRFDPFH